MKHTYKTIHNLINTLNHRILMEELIHESDEELSRATEKCLRDRENISVLQRFQDVLRTTRSDYLDT